MKAATLRSRETIFLHIFQSTPPVKAATRVVNLSAFTQIFQSTPPVKAATSKPKSQCAPQQISIHAAREGGDAPEMQVITARVTISIHAAREGGDETSGAEKNPKTISIHAAREGGDEAAAMANHNPRNFNPRRP